MILLIDNFDSFTYNIFQYLRKLGHDVLVKRNNAITLAEIETLNPSHIILSPGPGRPEHAGIIVDVVRHFKGKIPILGICLGHQAIGLAFGGEVVKAQNLFHGKGSDITHDGKTMYSGIANPFHAIRYHSLVIRRPTLPAELEISAWTDDGEIMGVRHRMYSIEGMQFHPESIGTQCGLQLFDNFINHKPEKNSIQAAIKKLCSRQALACDEAEYVMEEIMSGEASAAQIAGFLTALSLKGEDVNELTGLARVMRRKATSIPKPPGIKVLDTCGTGGDGSGTFNISTAAALVAAGAGAVVAKHGNRSITSRCGSADLLEALGVNISASAETMTKALADIGIAFLFAPKLHQAMKHAVPVRRDIGIRTAFNILGPLANPANADFQIIGVFAEHLLEKMAKVLVNLGVERALVVHGCDGLDELTLTGPSQIMEVNNGWIKRSVFDPRSCNLSLCPAEALQGGSLKINCEKVLAILDGEKGPGRDVVLLNAAAAIYVAGLAGDIASGVQKAANAIDSGAARQKLHDLAAYSNR